MLPRLKKTAFYLVRKTERHLEKEIVCSQVKEIVCSQGKEIESNRAIRSTDLMCRKSLVSTMTRMFQSQGS